jgi:hypothetical protein
MFLVVLLVAAVTSGAASATGTNSSSIWNVETTVNPKPTQVNNSSFAGVSASGPDEAWAVGTYEDADANDNPLAEHWNGTSWTRVTVPAPAGQTATLAGADDSARTTHGQSERVRVARAS